MNTFIRSVVFLVAFSIFSGISILFASQNASPAGAILLEAPTARASSMGEAFSALPHDVAGVRYNPALVSTLKSGQVALSFHKGFSDDHFSQVLFGRPVSSGGFGLSIGYYDGGAITLVEDGTTRDVTAQKDLNLNFSYATQLRGLSLGLTGKYLSSELGETVSANALAGDLGLGFHLTKDLYVGGALQNVGTSLKYQSKGEQLPRLIRGGFSYQLPLPAPSLLSVDVPYHINNKDLAPSLGLETHFGPLAFRGGYKSQQNSNMLSFGTGFLIGSSSFDYALGLIDKTNALHQASYSLQFGQSEKKPQFVLPPPDETPIPTMKVEIQKESKPEEEQVALTSKDKLEKEFSQEEIRIMRHWIHNRLRLGDVYNEEVDWDQIYQNRYELIEQINLKQRKGP